MQVLCVRRIRPRTEHRGEVTAGRHPQSVDEIVDQSVDRVLDLIGLPSPETRRWNGPEPTRSK